MEKKYFEELYEILDEMNAQIEDIVNEHNNPEELEIIISNLSEKAHEFVAEFQQETEKYEMIEMEMEA